MQKPKQPPRRRPKPRPKPRKPPKSEVEKEKARKRAALIRRITLLTLFLGFSGIFLYNNRDYFIPALDNYSIHSLFPQKNEKTERLKAAKRAEADSIKAVKQAETDSIKAAKRAAADSVKAGRKEAADMARAAKWAEEDSVSAVKRTEAAKAQNDWAKQKAEADSLRIVRRAEADSIKIMRKAEAEKAKAEKAERKRVESARAKKPDGPKEPKALKSVDEVLGGLEFADNAATPLTPELPYGEPEGQPEIAKTEPLWQPKTEPVEKETPAQADAAAEPAPYAESERFAPPPPKPGLVERAKKTVVEKLAALVKFVKPEPAPPSKQEPVKAAESGFVEDTPVKTAKPEFAKTAEAEPVPPPKPESARTAEAEPVPPPMAESIKAAEAEPAPPPKPESAKAAKTVPALPKEESPPPTEQELARIAKAEPPAKPEEDTFYLSNIPCKLADRGDLTIYLTAELIFNGEPIRQEIIFKRGALTAVAGNVVRGHEYGNVSTAQISKDLLTAFNGILLAGDLNRVDVKDFRVEPGP